MDALKQTILRREKSSRFKKHIGWRRVYNELLTGGGRFKEGTGSVEYDDAPDEDLVCHADDQWIFVDRFFYDEEKCENNNPAGERKNTLVFRQDLEASLEAWKGARGARNAWARKDVPDTRKIRTWPNVLNRHQYGYGTDDFAKPRIEKNMLDMVRYEHTISRPAKNTFRILSYNVHCFLNSFACIVKLPDHLKPARRVLSGKDVAAFANGAGANVLCFQEFTALPDGRGRLMLHEFSKLFAAASGRTVSQYITQGSRWMPNFIGVATMVVGKSVGDLAPVVGRAARSNIAPPYDELYRPFLRLTVSVHGRTVHVWNIHPEAAGFSKKDNEGQLKSLFADLSRETGPVLVVGDYNNGHVDPFLEGTGFQRIAGRASECWRAKGDLYTSWAGSYIDHVCANQAFRNLFSVDVQVVPIDLSDHFPVFIDIVKKKAAFVRNKIKGPAKT